jgi:hypothetical protein
LANIHDAIQDILSEVEAFAEHKDSNRLANALRELKVLGAEAMMAGNINATNMIGTLINDLPDHAAAHSAMLEQRFLSVLLQEFEPTLEMAAKITKPTQALHHKLVKSLIANDYLRPDDDKLDLCVSMARHDHYAPLSKLLDAIMTFLDALPAYRRDRYVGDFSELMARVSEVTTWSHRAAPLLVDVFVKHAPLLVEFINNSPIEDCGAWNQFANTELLRILQARKCPELVEVLFHRYAMNTNEPELVTELIQAGLSVAPATIDQFLAYSYEAKIGEYPYTAIQLHLCSGGDIPMRLNFKKFGGGFVGEFINKGLRQWAEQYPEVCLKLAHQFLDHDPDGSGLFSQPLPRILIECSERLRADNLSSDLGL